MADKATGSSPPVKPGKKAQPSAAVLVAQSDIPAPAIPGKPKSVRLGVAKSEVLKVQVVDTDFLIFLKSGGQLFVKDGALNAASEPAFELIFLDGSVLGQDMLGQSPYATDSSLTSVPWGEAAPVSPVLSGPPLVAPVQEIPGPVSLPEPPPAAPALPLQPLPEAKPLFSMGTLGSIAALAAAVAALSGSGKSASTGAATGARR